MFKNQTFLFLTIFAIIVFAIISINFFYSAYNYYKDAKTVESVEGIFKNINHENDYDAIVLFTGRVGRLRFLESAIKKYAITKPILISGTLANNVTKKQLFKTLNDDQLKNIIIDTPPQTTIQNAEYTKKWLYGKNYKHILLITDYQHMPRSVLLIKRNAIEGKIIPIPLIWDDSPRTFLIKELLKFTYSYIFYWTN